MTDHFPAAAKAIWQFDGIWCSSRHIPGVRFPGLIHPGLIGTAPSQVGLHKSRVVGFCNLASDPAQPLIRPRKLSARASCNRAPEVLLVSRYVSPGISTPIGIYSPGLGLAYHAIASFRPEPELPQLQTLAPGALSQGARCRRSCWTSGTSARSVLRRRVPRPSPSAASCTPGLWVRASRTLEGQNP